MVNVKDQITASNYPPNLLMGGAVLIGGGANLKNITLAFKNFVPGISKVSVVKSTQTNVRTQAVKGPLRSSLENGAFIAAISILAKGKQPCTGIITEDRKPEDLFNDTTSASQEHVTSSIDEPETTPEVKQPKEPKKPKGPGVVSRAWKWIKNFADEVAEDD